MTAKGTAKGQRTSAGRGGDGADGPVGAARAHAV